tara:strand:+ start:267 stop:1454 length:1188 start_codon:yes stop_codon:yes gene_type:complete
MFENISPLTADPILGLMAEFRDDKREMKIDLGVGVYRDDQGNTPIMQAVKEAEKQKLEIESTKSYIGPNGSERYNKFIQNMTLGSNHVVIKDQRIATIQTPGGCGALKIGAELIKKVKGSSRVWVSSPTWANHIPLLGGAGLKINDYDYYCPKTKRIDKSKMFETLEKASDGDIILVHGCCHNPSGVDLDEEDWNNLTELLMRKNLIPFIDLAYQGLGDGLEEDVKGMRKLLSSIPEALVACSYSKNFGLYRERTGGLHVILSSAHTTNAISGQLGSIARGIYSMPPAHGALLVEQILGDNYLTSIWTGELNEMRNRILDLRMKLALKLSEATNLDFNFITNQKGMFSFLGISKEQINTLKNKHAIYMVDSSRINIAGLNSNNLEFFVKGIKAVV